MVRGNGFSMLSNLSTNTVIECTDNIQGNRTFKEVKPMISDTKTWFPVIHKRPATMDFLGHNQHTGTRHRFIEPILYYNVTKEDTCTASGVCIISVVYALTLCLNNCTILDLQNDIYKLQGCG